MQLIAFLDVNRVNAFIIYWGIFSKLKVKNRSIISAYYAKMCIIYKN